MSEKTSEMHEHETADLERDYLVRELERRIQILEGLDESAFGRFTILDWILCVIAFVILPHIALWMFA